MQLGSFGCRERGFQVPALEQVGIESFDCLFLASSFPLR